MDDTRDRTPSAPLTRIGIIGGGQLAWMMADAAAHLGLELTVQTPHGDDPAVARVGTNGWVAGGIADPVATERLATACQVITFENEFVDLEALGRLERRGVNFRPKLAAIAPILDKYHQRQFLQTIGLPVPPFAALTYDGDEDRTTWEDGSAIAFPIVLKTRRHGYDGQGTFVIPDRATLGRVWERLDRQPVLIEAFIPFERELAALAARSPSGEVMVYPIVETQQEHQVCTRVIAPAPISPTAAAEADRIARAIVEKLDGVGMFAVELFLAHGDRVLVNEIAPRTHNSGHFSIDACHTSQFEQHLRAVAGLPLGDGAMPCAGAVMVNLLGFEHSRSDYGDRRAAIAQAIPTARVYWYGKTSASPGRKLGHVTVTAATANPTELLAIARRIEQLWYPDGTPPAK